MRRHGQHVYHVAARIVPKVHMRRHGKQANHVAAPSFPSCNICDDMAGCFAMSPQVNMMECLLGVCNMCATTWLTCRPCRRKRLPNHVDTQHPTEPTPKPLKPLHLQTHSHTKATKLSPLFSHPQENRAPKLTQILILHHPTGKTPWPMNKINPQLPKKPNSKPLQGTFPKPKISKSLKPL